MHKVIILGDGIAGLTAAIYTARADLEPLVLAGPESGGQLTYTTDVENFPGFPEGVQGPELINRTRTQAKKFGATFETGIVTELKKEDDHFELITAENTYAALNVIVATGASARWLELESEEQFRGKGVSTCATCDGFFYKGKDVIVVGGGDSAMEESLFLTKFVNRVTVVHRRDEFRASQIMQNRFFDNDKTSVIWNTEVKEYLGNDNDGVTGVVLENNETKERHEKDIDGVFLAIGHDPNTDFLEGVVDLDSHGYLISDNKGHTGVEGLFAAGDVHDTRFRQAVTAAGSGCKAAMEAEKRIAHLESKA